MPLGSLYIVPCTPGDVSDDSVPPMLLLSSMSNRTRTFGIGALLAPMNSARSSTGWLVDTLDGLADSEADVTAPAVG